MAASFGGQCHCGAIGFTYTTELAPSEWSVRACRCSFCRAHGARCSSDPRGSVRFAVKQPDDLVRYRFALRTADFLLCRSCGVYVGALITTDHGAFAIVNLNALTSELPGVPEPDAVSYDAESRSGRVARREERWTPVVGAV